MTTYGFNLSFDEQEFWAIKEAMEFYISSEATELRKKNPHLVKYAADIKLNEILSSGKLYNEVHLHSSNNFGQISNQNRSSADDEESLFTVVIQLLKRNPKLLTLTETPIRDMFLESPTIRQLIHNCIIDCLENPKASIGLECKHLLEDGAARELFCSQIGKELYRLNTQSHPT
jgi:hypothetical protein